MIRNIIYAILTSKISKSIFKLNDRINAILYERIGEFRSIYYKCILGACGNNLTVYGKPRIFQPQKIFIGNNFTINNGAQISPRGKVFIGDNVTMSRGSQITAGSLDTTDWVDNENAGNWLKKKHVAKDVHIADGTWLCVNSIVLPGVNISGKGVIVSAGAVVTKDIVEDFVVVGGVPAKIVKKLKN